MSKKLNRYHIYVHYFIQNDDWESIGNPNLFVLPQEFTNLNDVKAQMVYDNFPLINKQNYYLRFFLDDKSKGLKGWVDYPPNGVIPIYNEGHVYVKVLRIPKGIKINFKKQDEPKPKETSNSSKNISTNFIFMEDNKNQQKSPSNSPFGQNIFPDLGKDLNNMNLNGNLSSKEAPPQPQPQPQSQKPIEDNSNKNIPNTLNLDDWGAFSGNNGSDGSLNLDIDNNTIHANSTNNIHKVDPNLLNVFSNISSAQSQPMQQAPGYDFTVNMNNNNGKMYPIDNIPNNLSNDDIKDRVDPIINKWTLGGEGKKNLLFLLTTLHEVWTKSNLGTPDMQTLVNDKAAVRTFYKKAMRELHADKNRDKDNKTKYIASCLYQILNEANSNY